MVEFYRLTYLVVPYFPIDYSDYKYMNPCCLHCLTIFLIRFHINIVPLLLPTSL